MADPEGRRQAAAAPLLSDRRRAGFYLGFKFVGTGIHALQVAGVAPATPIPWLPAIPLLGIFPTWESFLPQLLLLVVGASFYLYTYLRQRQDAVAIEAQAA
ncbi:MAG: hypothetical protein IPM07_21510 [Anaerolineales bacterium]|nr:hypothetical protein [Anaerolineales bacterium]